MTSVVVLMGTRARVADMIYESVYNFGDSARYVVPTANFNQSSHSVSSVATDCMPPAASTAVTPPVNWHISMREWNRRMHAANGNTVSATISGKEARNLICSKLVRAGINLSDAQSYYDRVRHSLRSEPNNGEELLARMARQSDNACVNSMQRSCRDNSIEFPFAVMQRQPHSAATRRTPQSQRRPLSQLSGNGGAQRDKRDARPKPAPKRPQRPQGPPSKLQLRDEDFDVPVIPDIATLTRDTAAGVVLVSKPKAVTAATELRGCAGRIALVTVAPIVLPDGTALPHVPIRVPLNRVTESGECSLACCRGECLTQLGDGPPVRFKFLPTAAPLVNEPQDAASVLLIFRESCIPKECRTALRADTQGSISGIAEKWILDRTKVGDTIKPGNLLSKPFQSQRMRQRVRHDPTGKFVYWSVVAKVKAQCVAQLYKASGQDGVIVTSPDLPTDRERYAAIPLTVTDGSAPLFDCREAVRRAKLHSESVGLCQLATGQLALRCAHADAPKLRA
eukprot:gene7115-2018_t